MIQSPVQEFWKILNVMKTCLLYTSYVYCVEDNKLVRTSVTVGLMDDEHAVIEDGLTTDSLVVDNWSAKLRNGAEVEIVTLNGEDRCV